MPGPPPAAGVPVGSTRFVAFAVVELLTAEVAATGEVAGVGDTGLRENHGCLAGAGDAAAGDSAMAAAASFFLERFCLPGLGDAATGDSAAAAVAAGEASRFLECLCLAALADASGLAVGVGLWAINVAAENAVNAIIRPICLFMAQIKDSRRLAAMPKNDQEAERTS